jgi:hypothetical protein
MDLHGLSDLVLAPQRFGSDTVSVPLRNKGYGILKIGKKLGVGTASCSAFSRRCRGFDKFDTSVNDGVQLGTKK